MAANAIQVGVFEKRCSSRRIALEGKELAKARQRLLVLVQIRRQNLPCL
jgi:hypothetical protein